MKMKLNWTGTVSYSECNALSLKPLLTRRIPNRAFFERGQLLVRASLE